MHYSYEIESSREMLFDLAVQLQTNERLISDFGQLYFSTSNLKKSQKKTVWEFITENEVKIKAMSIWKTPRGKKFICSKWKAHRPDFIGLDDIDVDKSVRSVEVVEKNYNWIKWELFGWLSQTAKVVFLWNVINDDWIVPRFREDYKNNKDWIIYWIPIRLNWEVTWDRFVPTDDDAEIINKFIKDKSKQVISLQKKRRDQWEIWYNQNFNLIPYVSWNPIIKKSNIKYYLDLPSNVSVIFWIDPAFSLKTNTDSMALTITAHYKWKEGLVYKYILDSMEFNWDEKDENLFVSKVENLYHRYKCKLINIEANNGWEIIWRMLKKRWLAVKLITADKDKVTRLREYQWAFERGDVYFNPEMNNDLEKQLLKFPNSAHDDLVDSMVMSFYWKAWSDIFKI